MSWRIFRGAVVLWVLCSVAPIFSAAQAEPSSNAKSPQASGSALLAPTPPMGWNSWDGYGTTIDEKEFRANADWFANNLKPFGWKYVTIDMEWFVTNPTAAGNSKQSKFQMDAYGRYTPPASRFPSAANNAGFKPLATFAHSLGLKFGIHILQGIPREAVEKNLPIEGSPFHARDAANKSGTCPWNPDNYDLDASKPAAQAYYDSIARLYASWGVDFIKVDCIASRPYKGDEIRMLSTALQKTGRPIVLSLSPGAAPLDKVDEMRKYAQMWRISDDIWDLWHSNVPYPQGLGDQFANVAKWEGLAEPGHWPDADMLPLGYLGPAPGWGQARGTRLSHDEQRTFMTLWCIFRSPLMVGGRLPSANAWTVSLLTNREVLDVDQHSTDSRPVVSTDKVVVWRAKSPRGYYVAVFNVSPETQRVSYNWSELGLQGANYRLRDLWEHKDLGNAVSLSVELSSHASILYSVTAGGTKR
ncbi:MAG TPA: glycoside hydrolase family 27 protein [Terriglobales bacterium]|nr:glycoside hydrolase family 27 protein [Terriglobales bacterium]